MSLLVDNFQLLSDRASHRLFTTLFGISQCLGGMCVLLVAIWMGAYQGGFAWNESPDRQFNYHPTFMIIGMLFIYGEAILVYRVFRHERKRFSKLLHLTLHSMSFIFFVVALRAVWESHDLHRDQEGKLAPLPNLYSLHSWIGFSTILAWCTQYTAGFITFFFPGLPIPIRQLVLPFHQLTGIIIFIMATASALMGIAEKSAWSNNCWTKDGVGHFCAKQGVSNFLGVCLLGYSSIVVCLVLNPRWRRRPLPEEESLHQLTETD